MRIIRENCTGLVVDIQDKLFPLMAEKESMLASCIKLIEGLQVLGIPILVTQQYSKGLGGTIDEISSLFDPFTFFEKETFSCLENPDYYESLQTKGRTTVLLSGIESHVCVLQTAIDLQEQGFQPIIISDCVSSRNLNEKRIALDRFQLEGIRVSTVESVLFELTRSSKAPEFKTISKLIK